MYHIYEQTLGIIYVANLTNNNPIEMLSKFLRPKEITARMLTLRMSKCINDENALTDIGRSKIKVVLAGGVFDIIHSGHVYTLEEAKKLGNVLVVVVAIDSTAEKLKNKKPKNDVNERKKLVDSLSVVDACVSGQSNIFDTVRLVNPDVIALGYDQNHQEDSIRKGCKNIGISPEITRLGAINPDMSTRIMQKDPNVMSDL